MILLAIFRILPRRSFGLTFFGVDDDDERFLLLEGVVEDGLDRLEGRSFFRLISVDEDSKRKRMLKNSKSTREKVFYLQFLSFSLISRRRRRRRELSEIRKRKIIEFLTFDFSMSVEDFTLIFSMKKELIFNE